jgi:hypothetical protein
MPPVESFQCGPSGGRGGEEFVDDFPGDRVKVQSIRVWHGNEIDAIQLLYSDGSTTPKRGGSGGTLTPLDLEPDEFFTEISGRYGDHVDSLIVRTNVQTFQKLGGNGGDHEYRYQVPEEDTEIIGFLGASGTIGSEGDRRVDAIGIIGRRRFK